MSSTDIPREGSVEAPTRHPLDWHSEAFYDEDALNAELERVFDICHGCRRCFSLCQAFPTLFDLIDESETLEVDGVDKADYGKVVDRCYLCDLCYKTKCPYVPPHPWNVDFPKLMLRAKAVQHRRGDNTVGDKVLSAPAATGRAATLPGVVRVVNRSNGARTPRRLMDKALGVHPEAKLPEYPRQSLRKRLKRRRSPPLEPQPTSSTTGRVALFNTCYCSYIEPELVEDLIAVYEHNGIEVRAGDKEKCCGMPKLEIGDLEAVAKAKERNVPRLAEMVDAGYDLVAAVPSCVLMFKQELPLMFPDDAQVEKVKNAFFDPFEYLMLRHKEDRLRTDFAHRLGTVSYHVACHLRVQDLGLRTKELLELVPGTEIKPVERCSGHDGTYGVKTRSYEDSRKIARKAVRQLEAEGFDALSSDCPLAGHHLAANMSADAEAKHPVSLLRRAYGI